MKKSILFLCSALLVLACSEQEVQSGAFVLNKNDIVLLERVDQESFIVKMTEAKAEELFQATRQNLNKELEIYIEDIFVSSPVVSEPISGSSMRFCCFEDLDDKYAALTEAIK